jgi:phage tail sheath protein FI
VSSVRAHCTRLWEQGALAGTRAQAFDVQCDERTTAARRGQGQLVAEVRLALSVPAEFIDIHIVHHGGAIEAQRADARPAGG